MVVSGMRACGPVHYGVYLLNGYTIPQPLTVMPADDGGVLVVCPSEGQEVLADYGRAAARSRGVVLLNFSAEHLARQGKRVRLHRCLTRDVENGIGEEPGWWDVNGSGITLDFWHIPYSAMTNGGFL